MNATILTRAGEPKELFVGTTIMDERGRGAVWSIEPNTNNIKVYPGRTGQFELKGEDIVVYYESGELWRTCTNYFTPSVVGDIDIMVLAGYQQAVEMKQRQQWEEKQRKAIQREEAIQRLLTDTQYDFLTRDPMGRSGVKATANIRKHLKKCFPNIKFSVRTTGTSSVDVTWTLGPTPDEVKSVVNRYLYGSFDGMTDSYQHNDDNVWPAVFGGVRYTNFLRNIPDLTEPDRILIEQRYGLELPRIRACYQHTNQWHYYRLLSQVSFPSDVTTVWLEKVVCDGKAELIARYK